VMAEELLDTNVVYRASDVYWSNTDAT